MQAATVFIGRPFNIGPDFDTIPKQLSTVESFQQCLTGLIGRDRYQAMILDSLFPLVFQTQDFAFLKGEAFDKGYESSQLAP